ncbi:hypothetical protein KAS24_01395, partial [Candidatus Bathyarchaeota archaeon]|nr:hypothetical protein [Candidatus Bathyarchaeota archaeon]
MLDGTQSADGNICFQTHFLFHENLNLPIIYNKRSGTTPTLILFIASTKDTAGMNIAKQLI